MPEEIKTLEREATPKGQNSSKENESNSTPVEKTYSEIEHKKAVEDAIAQYGDRIKKERIDPIAQERDSFKEKLSGIEDNAAEIDRLQTKLDAMASDDPDKFDMVKELKAAREERKQLKGERATLEREKTELADSKAEVDKWKRDQLVYKVADEFSQADGEDADFDSFMTAADKFKLNDREGLVALAETMGLKLKAEVAKGKNPPLKIDSGGAGGALTDAQIKADYIKNPYNPTFKARYLELRKKFQDQNR